MPVKFVVDEGYRGASGERLFVVSYLYTLLVSFHVATKLRLM
jgi:hypothetical protein